MREVCSFSRLVRAASQPNQTHGRRRRDEMDFYEGGFPKGTVLFSFDAIREPQRIGSALNGR